MGPLQIAFIIIGIIIIAISCILVDKSQKTTNQPSGKAFSVEGSITEEDKKQLREKMNEMFSEISEEVIVHTDDTLSNLSNEKIIAVNEFSEQILEKIRRNHEEVVFLYNMLNDKEKELKAAVKEIDNSKKKVQDIMESRSNTDKPQTSKEMKSQVKTKQSDLTARKDKQMMAFDSMTISAENTSSINSENTNYNSQILALHSQGKSIMEISKLLDLGQGEVKLVIDLYKGKK